MKQNVAIGFLGINLDSGKTFKRWERWRPSVDLCRQDDLIIARYELLLSPHHRKLAEQVKADIELVSPSTNVILNEVEIDDPWDLEEVYQALFDFADTHTFDTEKENYFLNITTGTHVGQICLFLLNEAHYLPGKIVQLSPPRRSRSMAPATLSIIDLDLSKYDTIADRFEQERKSDTSYLKSGIATRNQSFNAMIDEIEHVAIRSQSPVLLTGPTGAGKSHLARRIFNLKKRRHQIDGNFIEINCATIKGQTAASALFGHKRGAYAGATKDRAGLLRSANNGMLFLDEVDELGLDEQAMILRALEDKKFYPVGSDTQSSSHFQLIAGTTIDLVEAVAKGTFREDLLARINMWSYALPGLKDRREDIEANLEFELKKFSSANHRKISFNKEARQAYLKFAHSSQAKWTANFRDLTASVTRLCTFTQASRIDLTNVKKEIERLKSGWRFASDQKGDEILLQFMTQTQLQEIDPFERPSLANVITTCRSSNSLSQAGRNLFAVSRVAKKSTNDADRLKKYLARFNLSWESIRT